MDDRNQLIDIFKNLNVDLVSEVKDLEKFKKLVEVVEFGMGQPIVLSEEIPQHFFILLEASPLNTA